MAGRLSWTASHIRAARYWPVRSGPQRQKILYVLRHRGPQPLLARFADAGTPGLGVAGDEIGSDLGDVGAQIWLERGMVRSERGQDVPRHFGNGVRRLRQPVDLYAGR